MMHSPVEWGDASRTILEVLSALASRRVLEGVRGNLATPPSHDGHMAAAQGALDRARDIHEREQRVAALCGRINSLEGELAGVLADLFALKAHEGQGLRSAAHYVGWVTGSGRSRACALAVTAERLGEFPATTARLQLGDISLDQTAAITRCAPAWADGVLAECAGAMTPAQLAKTARIHREADLAEQAAAAGSSTPSPPPVHESLEFHGHDAGGYVGRLRLDADHGAEFEAAVRAHMDVLWNEWKAAGGAGRAPRPLDAFLRMMRRAGDADTAGVGAVGDHRRHLVILHVDVATRVGEAHMGPALPGWVTEAWSCDATFQTLFTSEGRALGVGPTRSLPRRLRLAVEQRDGGCRVPGCGSRIVHLHHVRHHAHGGPSETWNLVGICPTHHRSVHRGELILIGTNADDPHGITFTTPGGTPLSAPQPTICPDAVQRLADLAPTHVASRPNGGRVDWRNVIPLHPNRRLRVPVAPPASHGDRNAEDSADPDPDPDPDKRSPAE